MNHGRRQRLDYILDNQKQTRNSNGLPKRKSRARRDDRVIAKLKASAGADHSPEVASWIAEKLGKPARKASAAEIQTLIS